ncbi:hypothetical protein RGU72_06245 [Undibacterium sp. 5I1]|uniref:hypothetical protein n=1 Tax=unclassified Undibacterium TaxID=2630295 RepID=UPI002AB45E16|nr:MULTISPECIES: hypothetical protein [unclassified Undibacterium]MDY7537855.1 hypothetical protein [Undibacterium sp. 5I1]MEB0232311.1 hypothetical protein [Undibacterium sp. 10I3]MEB0259120.1 hypothetical protein [Undibacterium sp. 5I1]
MATGQSQTLRSKQRTNIMHAYRGRGRGNSNLWLVYSIKTNKDYILPSDRQLIHWLHYLETNPEVKSFDLEPTALISVDSYEARATELDARVLLANGRVEWHEVKSDDNDVAPGKSKLEAQASAASAEGISYRTFSDKDLSPHVRVSLRWLKAIGFASVLRDRPFVQESVALDSVFLRRETGTIAELLNDLPDVDPAILKGLLVRLAISGHIHLDLNRGGFRSASIWRFSNHVVS